MVALDRDLAFPLYTQAEVCGMREWLLKKIVVQLNSRTIEMDGRLYLTRWYLWPKGPRTADDRVTPSSPFAIFIHYFHRSDDDRACHNHPWAKSWALILKGGYIEERQVRGGTRHRVFRPGHINVITKNDYHRVDLLDPSKGSWSLFVAGRNVGSWGFRNTPTSKHVPWREFIGGENTVS
jgi:hypothetical protein